MSSGHGALSQRDDQALARHVAQQVLEVIAPEELVLFDETADEYFADPQRVLQAKGRDEAVGFGIDMVLITPYILAVITPVIELLVGMVGHALKNERQTSVNAFVGRLFGRGETGASTRAPDDPGPLTQQQLGLVHEVALERAKLVGLSSERAALLADAITGGIWAAPAAPTR